MAWHLEGKRFCNKLLQNASKSLATCISLPFSELCEPSGNVSIISLVSLNLFIHELKKKVSETTAITTIVRLYHQGSCQLAIFSGEVVDGKIVASWELRTPTDKDLAHIRRIKKPIFLGV